MDRSLLQGIQVNIFFQIFKNIYLFARKRERKRMSKGRSMLNEEPSMSGAPS